MAGHVPAIHAFHCFTRKFVDARHDQRTFDRGVSQGSLPVLPSGITRLPPRLHCAAPNLRGLKHPELTQFCYENVISRGLETMRRLIARGIDHSEFKPTPLRDYPQLLVAPVLMAILWRSLFERHSHLDTNALLATNIDLLIDAVRAPSKEKPDGGVR
jgi:hypothetical protein